MRVAEVAARQHGVISRRQLLVAGLSSQSIARRVADRRLIRLHHGVYAVGHRVLRPGGYDLAAVLACGPDAVLSHRSAANAWGLRPSSRSRIDVTAPRGAGRKHAGIDAHGCSLSTPDVTALHGIPITTPARTLLDLAEVVPADHLHRAIARAYELRLYDQPAIEATMTRGRGRRGLKPLRAALAAFDPRVTLTRSALERRALALIAQHRFPPPEINAKIADVEVDLLWRAQRVAVELDGYAHHGSPAAFERDRRRDAALYANGYRVLRFSWHQVTQDADSVVRTLTAVLT